MKRSLNLKFFSMLCLLLLFASGAFGQLASNTANVSMTLLGSETLTITATPAAVTFASAAGTLVPANAPIQVTVVWNLAPTRTTLFGYIGVATATSALATTGANPVLIPSSALSASFNGGAAVPCNSTDAVASGIGAGGFCGNNISGNLLTGTNFQNSTGHVDTIQLNLQEPTPLAAGSYTGTLLIVYVAI